FGDERAREGDRVLPRRGLARDALAATHFYPEPGVAHKIEQAPECRLLDAERRVDAPHVIDHDGNRRALEPGSELVDEGPFEMHLQVPAELREARRERDRLLDSRALAEMAQDIATYPAEPLRLGAAQCCL